METNLGLFVHTAHDQIAEWGVAAERRADAGAVLDLLTAESLSGGRFSTINADGTPWQFCVSLGAQAAGLRYLTEVGLPATTLRERLRLTKERLVLVLERLGIDDSFRAAAEAICRLAPDRDSVEGGGVWIAAAFAANAARLRVYANIGWGSDTERWARLAGALHDLDAGGFGGTLRRLLPHLVPGFVPVGLAATIPSTPLELKLYLRPVAAPWRTTSALLQAAGAPQILRDLPRLLDRDLDSLHDRGLFVSLAMSADGGIPDWKLDVCGHCLFGAQDDPRHVVKSLCAQLGIDVAAYDRYLAALITAGAGPNLTPLHAFVGIGVHPVKGPRVNVYLKPPADGAPLLTSARRAGEALIARQRDGLWSDYRLPVGVSTSWTTAYVGNSLADAAPLLGGIESDALAAACDTVSARMRDGGWGYNEQVEIDADSSALATLLLRRCGRSVSESPLLRFRNADGGFATFLRDDDRDSWGQSHADVTPTVGRALADASIADAVRKGPWKSYWWQTDLYALAASARFLHECGEAISASPHTAPDGAFELALALMAAVYSGQHASARSLSASLIAAQQENGLWPADALLRVTDPASPVDAPSGRLYRDSGLVTSATALSALAAAASLFC